jgi:hypothetical protein
MSTASLWRFGHVTALVAVVFSAACGSDRSSGANEDTSEPSQAGNGGNGNGGNGFVVTSGPIPGGGATSDCSDAAKVVYVFSAEKTLYSFQPDKLLFSKVGTPNCPELDAPISMAIDRSGMAWVENLEGKLIKVSTSDASCQGTIVETNGYLGLAFSTDSATSHTETLYAADKGGSAPDHPGTGTFLPRFGTFDLATAKRSIIGEFSGAVSGIGAELTGTGDGRLFGFFGTTSPAMLAQIDRATAQTTEIKTLDGLKNVSGLDFAFAFWGGDFWLFAPTEGSNLRSSVIRVQTSGDGSFSTVLPDVGFHIIGAGVSTCAPVSPVVH